MEGESETQGLYRKCRNTMRVVLRILYDFRLHQIRRLIVEVTRALRLWRGLQNKNTGSFDDAGEYYADVAFGQEWFSALLDTMKRLGDITVLKRIGVRFSFAILGSSNARVR